MSIPRVFRLEDVPAGGWYVIGHRAKLIYQTGVVVKLDEGVYVHTSDPRTDAEIQAAAADAWVQVGAAE